MTCLYRIEDISQIRNNGKFPNLDNTFYVYVKYVMYTTACKPFPTLLWFKVWLSGVCEKDTWSWCHWNRGWDTEAPQTCLQLWQKHPPKNRANIYKRRLSRWVGVCLVDYFLCSVYQIFFILKPTFLMWLWILLWLLLLLPRILTQKIHT